MPGSGGQPHGAGRRLDQTGHQPPEPQGHLLGMPYDWRRPNLSRPAARWWNPDDRRLFTPKAFGWGYVLNLYWLVHPLRYLTRGS